MCLYLGRDKIRGEHPLTDRLFIRSKGDGDAGSDEDVTKDSSIPSLIHGGVYSPPPILLGVIRL